MSEGRLQGRVALVTGASSGLGKATALEFAREGARLVLAARRHDAIEETARSIREDGGEALVLPTDVSRRRDVDVLFDRILDHYGHLDIAFNNAGIFPTEALLHDIPATVLTDLVDTNLLGCLHCMQGELACMKEAGAGTIVNMASSAGLAGWSDNPVYAATKHAIVGLTRSAALQYAPFGIRINAVCPAFTEIEAMAEILADNPQAGDAMRSTIPLGRIGRRKEVAEAVTWLASDAASFCVGHCLVLDGGQTAGLWHPSE